MPNPRALEVVCVGHKCAKLWKRSLSLLPVPEPRQHLSFGGGRVTRLAQQLVCPKGRKRGLAGVPASWGGRPLQRLLWVGFQGSVRRTLSWTWRAGPS